VVKGAATTSTGEHTVPNSCPDGKVAIGGGVQPAVPADVTVHGSFPQEVGPFNTTWVMTFDNAGTHQVTTYVICETAPAH